MAGPRRSEAVEVVAQGRVLAVGGGRMGGQRVDEQVGADTGRRQHNDAEAQRRQLGTHAGRQGLDRGLGHVVDGDEGGPQDRVDAAQVDHDRVIPFRGRRRRHEERQERLRHRQGADDVDVQEAARVGGRGVDEGHDVQEPRIVDQHVQLAPVRLETCDTASRIEVS